MKNKSKCFGAGLIALDVILNGSPATLPKLSAGGSCGNVISILGYMGWDTYPIARLANDEAGVELLHDLTRWNVHTDYISTTEHGSTPIIIHRILKDKTGNPIHRFEFHDPETKSWLPQFKAITKNIALEIINQDSNPQVFYFDRMNPGTLELATYLKSKGTLIYFEPSTAKDINQFEKFLAIADIIKYSEDRIPDYKEKYPNIQCSLEIETLGKKGLVYRSKNKLDPNQWKLVHGFPLENIQDAAGAGDWCTSGIIKMLCSEGGLNFRNASIDDIEQALLFGQALGALNCLYDGARGLMYYYESKTLLKEINHAIIQKYVDINDKVKLPRIDTSTTKLFEDLYHRISK